MVFVGSDLHVQASKAKRYFDWSMHGLYSALVTRYRIGDYAGIEGFLSPREAAALYRYAGKVPRGGTILEIGSWKGKSTYCLARGLRNGQVLALDPFDASGEEGSAELYAAEAGGSPLRGQFDRTMAKLGVAHRIRVLAGYSRDFVEAVPQLNLLFIDGDHSIEGCRFDYANFAKFVAPGGYLMFHDFYRDRPELGPTWVVQNLVDPSREFAGEAVIDSLWIGRRA